MYRVGMVSAQFATNSSRIGAYESRAVIKPPGQRSLDSGVAVSSRYQQRFDDHPGHCVLDGSRKTSRLDRVPDAVHGGHMESDLSFPIHIYNRCSCHDFCSCVEMDKLVLL